MSNDGDSSNFQFFRDGTFVENVNQEKFYENLFKKSEEFKEEKYESPDDNSDDEQENEDVGNEELTRELFLKWYFTVLIMCLIPRPRLKDYWRTKYDSDIYSCEWIMKNWTFEKFSRIDKRVRVNIPLFEKIINETIKSLWNPFKSVVVDETLMKFNDKYQYRQHIKGKASDTGLKLYMLSDSKNYVFDFWLYRGYQPNASAIVLDSLSTLQSHQHVVTLDSYYGSNSLSKILDTLGFSFISICQKNRISKQSRGSFDSYKLDLYEYHSIYEDGYIVTEFKDKSKKIYFTQNFFEIEKKFQQNNEKPEFVIFYNKEHGHVDRSDGFLHKFT